MSLSGTGLTDEVLFVCLDQSYEDKFLCLTFFPKKVRSFASAASIRASSSER